jgi:hypothetical protein
MRSQSGRDKPPVPRQGDPRRSPQAPRTPSTRPVTTIAAEEVEVVGDGHDVKHLPGPHGQCVTTVRDGRWEARGPIAESRL